MGNIKKSEICDMCINEFQYYIQWHSENAKQGNSYNNHRRYFVIYCSFLDKLQVLSNNAIKLYLLIGILMNSKGYCVGNIDFFSRQSGLTIKQVHKSLEELVRLSLIHDRQYGYFNRYYIYPYDSEIRYAESDSINEVNYKYQQWINNSKGKGEENPKPFFFISKAFMKHWNNFKYAGAIKLYIYCGIRMNKDYGYMTDTLDKIAGKLGVTKRTVINWFDDLERNMLIERH